MTDSARLELRVSPEWLARLDEARGIASRGAYVKRCVELQVAKAVGPASADPRVGVRR